MVMGRKLDIEWIYLIIEAKRLGYTVEEIRALLQSGASTESSQHTIEDSSSANSKRV